MERADSMTDVSVVIPTYREAPNLRELIPLVSSVLDNAGLSGEIIVVDDNSNDGTNEVCAEFADHYPLQLLSRKVERGLSSAVIHGMLRAKGNILLVMDADLSHPPEKIPELVNSLSDSDADFAIGSRYVSGGTVDRNWGVFRWLNSRVSTLLAWPLTSVKDPMAGFFAIRRERFESARRLDPVGYKIGLELIVKCDCRRIREVPITFQDRRYGQSKLTLREQVNYLRHLKRLYEFRLGVVACPLQFLIVGCTGMVLDVVSFALLSLTTGFGVARALAIWMAMTWNFWLNRRLTFSCARTEGTLVQYVKFSLSCLVGALVNWSVSFAVFHHVEWFADSQLLSAFFGVVAGTVFNYVLSNGWVFRSPKQRAATSTLRAATSTLK